MECRYIERQRLLVRMDIVTGLPHHDRKANQRRHCARWRPERVGAERFAMVIRALKVEIDYLKPAQKLLEG